MAAPHPLSALSIEETNLARDVVRAAHPGTVLFFRQNYLWEPPKTDVLRFLELEHSRQLTPSSPRPARCAQVFYDVIGGKAKAQYNEAVVDLNHKAVVDHKVIGTEHQSSLTTYANNSPCVHV